MPRYIDADVARRIIDSPRSKEQMLLVLSQVEPADVVEVVRCKDCKHSEPSTKHENCKNIENKFWCWVQADVWSDNDFCSYGERREDE